jgi:hypothetical protein
MSVGTVVDRARVPTIIICRDLISDVTVLVDWLERAGHQEVILLDNSSTYPPLVEYLRQSPHQVVRLNENLGHQAPWSCGLVASLGTSPFVVSDPDVLPDDACPDDAVEYFQEILHRFPAFDQAGFGLHVDDLPDWYPHRNMVAQWERPFWTDEVGSGIFAAHIDTTFALYRPGTGYKVTEALRTGRPYTARHLPWYRDPRSPDEETAYYFRHRRSDIGYWNHAALPPAVTARLGGGEHGA